MVQGLRRLSPVLVAGLLLSGCISVTVGGGEETPEPSPTADPAATPSPGSRPTHVMGSGRVEVEQREVAGFDRVTINGAADLFIEQAGEESLSVEAEDNLLPLLISQVSDGRLALGVGPNTGITATRPIIFRLKVKSLRQLEASGTGRVNAVRLDTPELRIDTSGSVAAVFAGRAAVQEISLSGTGTFDGRDLQGERASVDASGTGEVIVNVGGSIDARVSGTATVRYLGTPQVDRRVSGLGSVERIGT
ncbi:MAG TPA: head GIN domain-containing protein [Actinomycetota bacterium]|nr:head GIN domain-containing protein [Actinomycetota bacterium]